MFEIQSLESVVLRIERMEQQNRALRRVLSGFVAVLVAAVCVAWTLGDPVPKAIEARTFKVVDEYGQARAILGLGSSGVNGLLIVSPSGAESVFLGHDSTGTALKINDLAGSPALKVFTSDKRGQEGTCVTVLRPGTGGSARPDSTDEQVESFSKHIAFELLVDSDGPALSLMNQEGQRRLVLGTTITGSKQSGGLTKRPVSSIVFLDDAGNVTWKTP